MKTLKWIKKKKGFQRAYTMLIFAVAIEEQHKPYTNQNHEALL